jgi:SAM-dependent methyltransferase
MRQLTDDFEARYRNGDTPWEDPLPWQGLDALFARLVAPGTAVLDVGCGLGTNALRLAALGYRVLGVDVSPTAIAQAQARASAARLDCAFRCADVLATSCGPVDAVFDRGCLHGFAEASGRSAFAAAVAAVLPPGGLWLDVSGSADNGDPPDAVREFALPRLTLADLAVAAEPHFETVEVTQGAFGSTPDSGFHAWVGVFRRRPHDGTGVVLPSAQAVARG